MYKTKTRLHDREKDRQPGALKTLVVDVTTKCNMNCLHCYAATFLGTKQVELPSLLSAIDQARELGVSHFVLMGGEPILDPSRVEAIIARCVPEESYITVTTNGWGMDVPTIQWLNSLQVDKISISLDSGIEEEHDANRKKGSFQRVLQAVDNVLDAGLIVSLDVVVTHQSLYTEGFRRALDFAIAKNIRMDLQIAEPVGRWDGKLDVLITPEDAAYILKLREDSPLTLQGEKSVKRDIFCRPTDHCPAATDFMHITADGNIFPCNFLQFSLGNIKDTSLKSAREAILSNPIFSCTTSNRCLCGEDLDFIHKYIMPHVGVSKPLDAYKIFNLEKRA